MPIVRVFMRNERWVHHGTGYSSGPVRTFTFNIVPGTISVHTAISAIQATTGGPLGAATGIIAFGGTTFGPNPADWPAQAAGRVGTFTTATQVTKGEMNVSTHFHVWE
jgi:hypothetical protein